MSKGSSESSSSSSEEGITGVGSLGCLCWESTTGTSHKGKATANIALNGPLCKGDILGVIKIWPNWGLNPGPSGYIPDALTTELSGLGSWVLASDSYQHVELKPSISCDRLHIQQSVTFWNDILVSKSLISRSPSALRPGGRRWINLSMR